ncbi:hypothetical protein NQZ68_005973 [Dissostichus eleginoides]|uniref:Uncharacterized protein n=2 Tax=Champsocephalus TaxID=52236 RepID=A0AAN8DTI3_CHAGU|nr:hypothetical protein NQZ68_005973 [Dissostichus eleginoides]KAK5899232.1 hypothetical protein CesoFtcFv8_008731 [Champsocephalus esox]KAK5926328.1 hypothetical protein CgunFtcFv8_021911 [Champsocephalus gunnari]
MHPGLEDPPGPQVLINTDLWSSLWIELNSEPVEPRGDSGPLGLPCGNCEGRRGQDPAFNLYKCMYAGKAADLL